PSCSHCGRVRSFPTRRSSDLQVVERVAPVALVDEVVPVRDLVVHRAAVVTVGNAAVHAARGLVPEAVLAVRDHELAIVADALLRIRVSAILALDLEEAGFLAHLCNPYSAATVAACSRSASSCFKASA